MLTAEVSQPLKLNESHKSGKNGIIKADVQYLNGLVWTFLLFPRRKTMAMAHCTEVYEPAGASSHGKKISRRSEHGCQRHYRERDQTQKCSQRSDGGKVERQSWISGFAAFVVKVQSQKDEGVAPPGKA